MSLILLQKPPRVAFRWLPLREWIYALSVRWTSSGILKGYTTIGTTVQTKMFEVLEVFAQNQPDRGENMEGGIKKQRKARGPVIRCT